MSKTILLSSLYLLSVNLFSQVPMGINYQGVARNNQGKPLSNQSIGIQITIFDSTNFQRSDEYIETHIVSTNSNGVYNLIIGNGVRVLSYFDSIKWVGINKWIEIQIDPNGGTNYQLNGKQKLMSVPYALRAGNYTTNQDLQQLQHLNDSLFLNKNGGVVGMKKYLDNTDSQKLNKNGRILSITNGNSIDLNDDDSTNEIQTLSISNDTIKLSNSNAVKLPSITNELEELMGCVFVHKFCTGDGTFSNPWKSADGSAGIYEALSNLTVTKRIVYFKPGYYHTKGALDVDFSKLLPNLSDPKWKTTFSGYGIEFKGNNSSIYVNGGAPLTGGKPGILFNWKGEHAFYWKFTGLQFYGVVDTALVQFGNSYEFPWNGCDFDIVANNGYVFPNYSSKTSPSCGVKICWALESRIHVVAVSATGSALVLETATFCTINGAFSNTLVPNTNTIYSNSYGLNLINCQSNTFTHMDLEVAFNGIKFDQWTIQNTFSAIFVSYCDTSGATFDNSSQVTNGKNIVLSIRSGGTSQLPSTPITQKLFTFNSTPSRTRIENFYGF